MKRSIIFLLMVFLLSFTLTSCKKNFLEVENTSKLYRQTYVKDLITMEHYMNGIYVMLNGFYEQGIGAAYPELVADNLEPLTSGTQSLVAPYSWTQQASDEHIFYPVETSINMNGNWTFAYQVIRACNFVIEDIDKYRNENPDKANDIKGQAYAIRAMVHFKLVNIFAQSYKFTPDASHPGIPYITTSDITIPYTRQSVAEVYDRMIDDFNNAIELLPSAISDARYMNVAAAKALLARVYLFKEDYANAKSLAVEICAQFPLLKITGGYPNDLFKYKKPSESEVLYCLTPEWLSSVGAYNSLFLGLWCSSSFLRYIATSDIVDILLEDSNDIRKGWVTKASGIWTVTKFPSGVAPEIVPAIGVPGTAYYPPVIRSSEMFLTVAEASAKSGDENTARTYLNNIRKRANPSVTNVIASGTALLDSIYKERRKELAFEGLRMYDLQRWKLGVHRVNPVFPTAKDLPFPSDKAISPVPLTDVNQIGISQNPQY